MRVLIFTPLSRRHPPALESIAAIEWDGPVDWLWLSAGDEPGAHRYDNVTRKYQAARLFALEHNYDAMLTVEDDIIVPPTALKSLVALGAAVAYGLTVWRHPPHRWSAVLELGPDHHVSLDQFPNHAAKSWGTALEVAGCGLFCTLIRREVLEQLDFHREGEPCCDWDFALDLARLGIRQVANLSVVCGHILEDGQRAAWPARDGLYDIRPVGA